VTHTSIGPSRSDRKATNLPSREIVADCSIPSKSVSGRNRAFASGFSGAVLAFWSCHPKKAMRVAPAAATSQRPQRRRCPAGAGGESVEPTVTASSLSATRAEPRLRAHASRSALNAYTDPIFWWTCRWTGMPSRFSQRCTVVTSRLKYAAISFHESSRSSEAAVMVRPGFRL
jgi:hypothetical protein